MSSWSKIVSDNIPVAKVVESPKIVPPTERFSVTPITSNFGVVMVSKISSNEKITPKIVTIGRKLTKNQDFVKRKLNNFFKFYFNEFWYVSYYYN